MTMKRILHCTLMFLVSVTAGCHLLSSPEPSSTQNSNSQPSPPPRHTINFAGAHADVSEALKRFNATGRSRSSSTVARVKDEVASAIQKLGTADSLRDRCTDCSGETKDEAIKVLEVLHGVSNKLGTDPRKEIDDLSDDIRNDVQNDLAEGASKLKQLIEAKPERTENSSSTGSSPAANPDTNANNVSSTGNSWVWSTLILALQVIGGLLLLVLFGTLLSYLWKRSWRAVELNVSRVVAGHLAATREAQPDYAPKLSSLSSAQADMSSRLTELDTELRSLARLVRESLAARRSDHNQSYTGLNYHSQFESASPKDEPEFPVSAVDYLGKMNRFANVVRPDFQNGILVNDPDGAGELVLIRDSRDDTQPFFVVPRATQFQTKQDFYTYYQKYYDCARPSAGDVWIIGPAVVEKVAGGWQLREKGMLEIR
jgi:hypothetical protein